jgi:hypothetical protein
MISPLQTTCEIIGPSPLSSEETPVTLQIVIPVGDALVLASDTKLQTWDAMEPKPSASGIVHSPKVVFAKRDVAVAFSGLGSGGVVPAEKLVTYLDGLDPLPDQLGPELKKFGLNLFDEMKKDYPKKIGPICTLVVLNPRAPHGWRIWKLPIEEGTTALQVLQYLIAGNERNAAIFWPQYFKADSEKLALQTATCLAATTILMGHELNPEGIGGLQIWQYSKTTGWKSFDATEIDAITTGFAGLQAELRRSVFGLVG